MTSHAMIDIECLGISADGVIASIGAVGWADDDPTGVCQGTFRHNITITNQDRALEGETVLWWLRQAPDVTASTFGKDPDRLNIKDALNALTVWGDCFDNFWAWPASFDFVILSDAYRQYKLRPPWGRGFRRLHCARTLCVFTGVKRGHNSSKHDPLEDAAVQAEALKVALSRLKR